MRELTWFSQEQPVDDLAIDAVERQLGVKFPTDFRAFAKLHHGGAPNETDFVLADPRKSQVAIGQFLSMTVGENTRTILEACRAEGLSSKVIPFADEAGGDLVCFDYRSGEPVGIVYWHHERQGADEYTPIAETFTSFLEMLKEPDLEAEEKLNQPGR